MTAINKNRVCQIFPCPESVLLDKIRAYGSPDNREEEERKPRAHIASSTSGHRKIVEIEGHIITHGGGRGGRRHCSAARHCSCSRHVHSGQNG